MADVVKLVFSSAFQGGGVSQFVAGAGNATQAALKTAGAARNLSAAMAAAGSAAGGAVGDITRFVSSFAQMGAVGALIAGVQIALDRVCDSIKRAADEALKVVQDRAERIRAKLDELNRQRMDGVYKALDKATVKAKEAASAFDAMASAYMKVGAARDATARSGASAAMSALGLEKSRAMAGAGDDNARALVGAGYDVRIARQNLADTRAEQDRAVAYAEDDAAIKARQAKMAKKALRDAIAARDLATETYNVDVDGDNQRNIEKSRAAKEAAEKAYAAAVNDSVAKQAEADAAAERVRQAENARTAALNDATRGILEAEETERRLVDAQKKAAEAELRRMKEADRAAEAQRRKVEADRKAAERAEKADALSALREGAKSQFEQAFDLWRDPEAAKAAQDEEKRRDADMKRFRKSVDRYGGKWRIDEYAELMRNGDAEGMQSRLAEWRKSSKFTPEVEQMVKAAAADQNANAAERALQNIEKNTADLAKKLDDLLSVK